MSDTNKLGRPGDNEPGIHIIEDKYVSTEVVEEKIEHDKVQYKRDNSCNVCDKKFKSINFLKNHNIKYHIKQGS